MTFLWIKNLSFLLEKQKISSVLEEIDALVSAPIYAYIIFAPLCLRAGDKSVHKHTHHCGYKHDEYGVQGFAFDFYVCHHH